MIPMQQRNLSHNLLKIHLRSFDQKRIKKAISQLEKAQSQVTKWSGIQFLPKRAQIYTVLRSPHVHKKAREQFQKVQQNAVCEIKGFNTASSLARYLGLLRFCHFFGVQMKIDVHTNSTF